MNSGIYKIVNTKNNRKYIGSTINTKNRFNRHKIDLNKNRHHSRFMQRDWNKDSSGFRFIELEFIDDPSLLTEREQYYIDVLKPEYNSCPVAGNCLGMKHRPETIEKMRKLFSGSGNAMYGKKHSEETKKKFSRIHKGKTPWNKGLKTGSQSEETKLKKSVSAKNRMNIKERAVNGRFIK